MVDGWSEETIRRNVEHDPNGGCWLWSGYVQKNGYASKTVNKKTKLAHRMSYRVFKGEIPLGFAIDHKCKVRCCVNPSHLEAVTYTENNRRSPRMKFATHCKRGHPLSGGNLYAEPKPGWKRCAECSRVAALASYHRNKKRKEMQQ